VSRLGDEGAGLALAGAGAVVFGGAAGLGRATVERLAAAGAEVVVADVADDAAAALAAAAGAKAIHADVTSAAEVEAAVALAAAAPAGLRVAVTCAGVGLGGALTGPNAQPLEHLERVIAINLTGTISVLRAAAAAMTANEPWPDGARGVCVTTASVSAFDGQAGSVAYAASKGGVVSLTLPAARELARFGIRVVSIAPGVFETAMTTALPRALQDSLAQAVPFPRRPGSPADFAALVAHVVANPMLNGEVIRIDGALRMPDHSPSRARSSGAWDENNR
jgi:NAD(P)-dependent dehydrogenase (short-subunit alcohol dehydrogenase family)